MLKLNFASVKKGAHYIGVSRRQNSFVLSISFVDSLVQAAHISMIWREHLDSA